MKHPPQPEMSFEDFRAGLKSAFAEFRKHTHKTALYRQKLKTPEDREAYLAGGVEAERGEVLGVIVKTHFKYDGEWPQAMKDRLGDEIADVCWYLSESGMDETLFDNEEFIRENMILNPSIFYSVLDMALVCREKPLWPFTMAYWLGVDIPAALDRNRKKLEARAAMGTIMGNGHGKERVTLPSRTHERDLPDPAKWGSLTDFFRSFVPEDEDEKGKLELTADYERAARLHGMRQIVQSRLHGKDVLDQFPIKEFVQTPTFAEGTPRGMGVECHLVIIDDPPRPPHKEEPPAQKKPIGDVLKEGVDPLELDSLERCAPLSTPTKKPPSSFSAAKAATWTTCPCSAGKSPLTPLKSTAGTLTTFSSTPATSGKSSRARTSNDSARIP